ncbi:phenylalanine--tRNA ligase beta subunit-related protein, partial [Aeromicrobium sp.]|uniref:phenylalanine--tRNA ligase beta subunit-related protein n=1 Tax=Aeromicrobium sp. TaxID=1871063 RepID=UPI0028B11621
MLADERFVRDDLTPVWVDDPYSPHTFVWFHRDLRDEVEVPGEIRMLHRDERIIVVDKPAFLSTIPRGRHVLQSVVVRLRAELGLPEDGTDGIIVLEGDPAIGEPAMPLLGADEVIFTLEVTPDMPHCLSIRGLARELAQGLGVDFSDPVTEDHDPVDGTVGVVLDDPRSSRFVAVKVTGFDPTRPSPAWLRRRVAAGGMRSISLAVDITNLVMLEIG